MKPNFTRTRAARAIGPIVALQAFAIISPLCPAQEEEGNRIELTREMLGKWIETERIVSAEKRDLEMAREMLTQRIELVRREIDSLKSRITEAEASIAEADRKREDLLTENTRLKDASSSLESYLTTLETGTAALLTRMPEPLRERVKPLSQRLPKEGAAQGLSSAERFQNVVGILNELNKFNREITVTSEVRQLDDGSAAEVTAVYLGVSQAFYTGSNDSVAGVGKPVDGVWTWIQMNDAAPAIARALAILKNEQVAAFVRVPMEIN